MESRDDLYRVSRGFHPPAPGRSQLCDAESAAHLLAGRFFTDPGNIGIPRLVLETERSGTSIYLEDPSRFAVFDDTTRRSIGKRHPWEGLYDQNRKCAHLDRDYAGVDGRSVSANRHSNQHHLDQLRLRPDRT